MSQITVDRVTKWDNVVLLPPGAAAPAVRLISSLRRHGPVWRQIKSQGFPERREPRRMHEDAERWDGMS